VDRPSPLLLHPHACAARATAEGPLPVAWHLHGLADRRNQLPRLRADVVVAREVARAVVGDGPVARDRLELAFAHQRRQELGVMHYLVAAADVGVLVAQRVEAVRA